MISAKTVNNLERSENKASEMDEKEPKTDEFNALLDGLFAAFMPVDVPLQNTPKVEKSEDFINANQPSIEKNLLGESTEIVPLQPTNTQILPIELKDFIKLDEKSKVDFLSKFNLENINNSEKGFDILPDKNSDLLKMDDDKFKIPDENNVKDFEIVTDEPATKTKSIFSSQNLFGTPALNIEKSESTNKLPKLFSEVAGLLEIHNPNLSRESIVNETQQTASADKAFIEQIEPHLLELAAMAMRTNEKQVLKMKLHPAELGIVEIRLEKGKNGKLTAHFQTESDTTKQILTENLDQLRDSLQNSGWQVEHLEISSDSASSNSFENRENQSQQSETAENNNVKASIFNGDSNHTADLNENILNRLLSLRA